MTEIFMWVFVEILFWVVFYKLGIWTAKLLTLGKYPKDPDQSEGNLLYMLLGLAVFTLICFVIVKAI